MYQKEDVIRSFVDVAGVSQVADAIAPLTESDFRTQYDRISESDYGAEKSDEDFRYTWDYFVALRNLYARAAQAGRSVVFSVDY